MVNKEFEIKLNYIKSKDMELNEYQNKAMETCMESSNNWSYMFLNLVGEVGELASKVAKEIRKEQVEIRDNEFDWVITSPYDPRYPIARERAEKMEELQLEAGDILWQLAGLCEVMGWSLEEVAQMNLDKLASRKERGVIDGNGDNR